MNNFCLLNTLAAMSFKTLMADGVSVLVLALFRNIVLLFVSYISQLVLLRNSSYVESQRQKIAVNFFETRFILSQIRSIFGTASFLLFTINLQLIPITFIIIIFQTNPLWSAILGYLINRERVSPVELIAMTLSFACVIMIAMARSTQSAGIQSVEATDDFEDKSSSSTNSALWLGVSLCLCHAWLFAGVGVISRRLQEIHPTELMMH